MYLTVGEHDDLELVLDSTIPLLRGRHVTTAIQWQITCNNADGTAGARILKLYSERE